MRKLIVTITDNEGKDVQISHEGDCITMGTGSYSDHQFDAFDLQDAIDFVVKYSDIGKGADAIKGEEK